MKQQRLSYSELEDSSNRLANLLNVHGCRQGDRICLLQKKSPLAVISILGILKVGCIYVPVDSSQPAARVASILDACEPRFLLADESAAELLDQLIEKSESLRSGAVGWMGARGAMANRFNLAFTHSDLEDSSPSPLSCKNTPQSPAHILFTSGSTGAPKGVVITHSNVIHFVTWGVEYFGITHSDRLSGQTPFHFDLSTFDIFGTFCAGAELHLVPPETALLPNKLADFIRNSELSQWFSVPSLLTYMAKFDVVKFNDFPALKRLLWCGEVLPTPTLIYLMERLPHVAFTNLYGPTEATIASSYHTLAARPKHGRAAVPIGRPCRGENLLVLDRDLRPIPPGETGELYIQGVGLS